MSRKPRIGMTSQLAAAALALAFAACSAGGTSNQGPGNFQPPTDTSNSNQGGGSGSANASAGSQSASSGSVGPIGGSSGSSTGGTITGSPSGATSGSGATTGSAASGTASLGDDGGGSTSTSGATDDSDAAIAMPSHGCGQGTSCTPATDLAAPDPADGVQFELKPGQVTIQPNQEAYWCLYKTIPGTAATQVGAFQSWMSPQSSHHFITFQAPAGSNMADGTLQQCAIGNGDWVYATSVAGQIIELDMPKGVGLNMPKGTQLILNMHFVNPSTTPATPTLKLNVLYAKNVQYQAGTMVSFNIGIDVPAGSALAPGKQTVTGKCSAPTGSKFFAVTTHTHKHAVETDVNFISNGQSTNIVKTTDWEAPDVGLWYAPNYLTVGPGDSFSYSCAYQNTGPLAVTVGETAASNEMCMAIGYYFPAGLATCD